MFVILKFFPVTVERVSAVLSIWPPPFAPFISIIGLLSSVNGLTVFPLFSRYLSLETQEQVRMSGCKISETLSDMQGCPD